MADVKPFSAVRYNRSKVKDIARAVCPPYDVIGPEDADTYRGQSQYNIINLILPGDNATGDKYSAAAGQFSEWLRGRVLLKDDSEGIYFLRQTFLSEGRKVRRVGFIALLKLSQERGILPHEHTNLAPKEDRLQLLRKVRANLSPIFILFKDKEKIIERVFNKCVRKGKPLLKIKDREGIESRLWRLEDKELVGLVTRNMRKKPVFIADGHHRFEVACNYLMEQKKADPGLGDDAPVNYIMSYFTAADSDGLVILPIHRLIRGLDRNTVSGLEGALSRYFDIESGVSRKKAFSLLRRSRDNCCAFLLYRKNKFSYIRLKDGVILDRIIEVDKPKEFKGLDVTVFNYLILKGALGIEFTDYDKISYMHSADEAINAVDRDDAELVFILNPIKINQLLKVASKLEKMPPKSTFFYPKILTGLTIHKFD